MFVNALVSRTTASAAPEIFVRGGGVGGGGGVGSKPTTILTFI